MPRKPKTRRKLSVDYSGGGSDFPQDPKNASSTQKGMIDDDMGKYVGVAPNRVPKTVDKPFEKIAGGGSPGSFYKKNKASKVRGKRP